MPAKPNMHGIKVFSLAFEVFCRKDNDKTDNTTVDICERVIHKVDLVNNQTVGVICGCTIYYYTSVKMAKHLYKKYGWSLVGTVVLTKKTLVPMKMKKSRIGGKQYLDYLWELGELPVYTIGGFAIFVSLRYKCP
jgi:hypothetical protein